MTEKEYSQFNTDLTELKVDVKYIQRELTEIKDVVKDERDKYVTQDQFSPIKNIVYGMVALTLTAVAGGLLALVIITK